MSTNSLAVSKKKRKIFLDVLGTTGKPLKAAQAAGYLTSAYMHKLRKEDKEFAAEWDMAVMAAGDILEEEAIRRAVDGVLEPNYYKGEIVGYTLKYSDALLTTLLKATKPDKYRERMAMEGKLNANIGITVLPMTSSNTLDWEKEAKIIHSDQEKLVLELPEADYEEVEPEKPTTTTELARV